MRRLLPLLALLSLGFAPVPFPKPDAAKEDLARMQGAWVLSYAINGGAREDVTQECVWRIEGDRLATSLDGKPGSVTYLTLDARTTPRSLDFRKSRDSADITPARYRVEADTLVVSVGATRPRDLSGTGPSNGVWVFRRKKR